MEFHKSSNKPPWSAVCGSMDVVYAFHVGHLYQFVEAFFFEINYYRGRGSFFAPRAEKQEGLHLYDRYSLH